MNNPLNATDPSGNFVFTLAMAFAGGQLFPASGGFGMNWASAKYVAQMGTIGGITNVLRGARFGDGFRSSGIGTLTGGIAGNVSNRFKLGDLGQGIAASIAGGTMSELTGGKFVNRAAYAAFSAALQSSGLLQGGGNKLQSSQTDQLAASQSEQTERPDLGWLGNRIRGQVDTPFEKDNFERYWLEQGDLQLSQEQFNEIVSLLPDTSVAASEGICNFVSEGKNFYAFKRDFYNTRFDGLLGRASVTYGTDGNPVGLFDRYDFNSKPWVDR